MGDCSGTLGAGGIGLEIDATNGRVDSIEPGLPTDIRGSLTLGFGLQDEPRLIPAIIGDRAMLLDQVSLPFRSTFLPVSFPLW